MNFAEFYTYSLLSEEKDTIGGKLEKYRRVTRGEIMEVAKEVFSEEPKITLLSSDVAKERVEELWLR